MRNTGFVVIAGAIALGTLLFGFWFGGLAKGDVKKVAGVAQEQVGHIKEVAEAAVQAATA